MKKRWMATGLAGVLALGGGGFVYQAYAAQPAEERSGQEVMANESAAEPIQDIETNAVDSAPIASKKNWLPEVIIEADGTPTDRPNIATKAHGQTKIHYATYFAADGKQYYVSQAEVEPSEGESFLQNAESIYKEPVRHLEIGGHAAVVVDGESRRVVHVLIEDQLLCIACWGLNAEELIAIADQIVTGE